ncbi:MAG: exonuclease SbcCD subunit D C-terminal domain-containing protein, partial [Candidatus Onthomonas sp.]|nr:exonuclease SbcCD subunit D C-terminal domain-containing protein [Candidatus Onthomonas sp.]
ELHHRKGITVVQVEDGKQITLSRIPLEPLHPLREIQGPLEALLKGEIVAQGDPEDYLHVTLTDELEPENAQTRLRAVYPNLMKLDFDNSRTRQEELRLRTDTEEKMPSLEELFAEFYQRQNGRELDEQSKALVGETLDAEGGEML